MWESSVFIIPSISSAELLDGSQRLFGAGCREMLIFATALLSLNINQQGLSSALNTKKTCTTGKWSLTAVPTVT